MPLTKLPDKLPDIGTTIFTHMSGLADQHSAINLSQGFPDFDAPEELCAALAHHTNQGNNQYAPMAGLPRLRAEIAKQIARYRGVQCDPDLEITVVPGATEGIFCAIMACVQRGDEVIVLDPCYDSYDPAIRLAGGSAVHVPLRSDDFTPDWDRIEAAVTSRSTMIIVNSPHNPSGSVMTAQDLARLEDISERHDLLVVSDEVYEHLVFDGLTHHSVLQRPALRTRSIAVFSFGKTFSVTGWKTGYCVATPALTQALRKVHQFVCFVAVTPVQHALADFMAAQPDYPAGLSAFYQHKRDVFCGALENSRFKFTPSKGTYFQVLDYSDIASTLDTELAEQWTQERRVASIPLSVFYQQVPAQQHLRFCFAKNDDILLEAARILCEI